MRKMNRFPVLAILVTVTLLTLCSCNSLNKKQSCCKEKGTCNMNITKAPFGNTPAGEQVDVYTLTNSNGLECRIITYGGTCISLKVPDREGKLGDILLGHDSLEGYLNGDTHPYLGSLVGRYGNRIAKGKFTIDGTEYTLATNNNENHLHGGVVGFSHKLWRAEPIEADNGVALKLQTISMDGDEGYPGTLSAQVIYTLTNRNELKIDYEATTDKPTVCNLTNHNYYNFTGAKRDILDHILMINAEISTPVDAGLIPTGELAPVEGTPFDFSAPKAIGKDINATNQQITYGGGYDHNWILNKKGSEMSLAAEVYEPTTGRIMTILTNEPAIQFYTGNFLDGTIKGKNGTVYEQRFGFCLETQHSPDSPNRPEWPTTTLRPGETYKASTIHKFSIR
jgi:aldose 1-epimerase